MIWASHTHTHKLLWDSPCGGLPHRVSCTRCIGLQLAVDFYLYQYKGALDAASCARHNHKDDRDHFGWIGKSTVGSAFCNLFLEGGIRIFRDNHFKRGAARTAQVLPLHVSRHAG